jgi:uncharacterized protein YbjT (DUF2867 family)
MKLLVLGATGPTGQIVVDQALAAGHSVRALVRTPGKLTTTHPELEVVTGQATDPADVAKAMAGVDAVISTLGAMKGTVITDATKAIIAGSAQTGVRRVVMLSSFAVARDRLGGAAKAMTGLAMGAVIKDKSAAEDLLRDSDLDWTVVHAVRLSNGPATGSAKVLPDTVRLHVSSSISRADVATLLIDAVTGPSVRRAIAISA